MAPLVLLTGATGLVGFRVLLEALKTTDYNIRITARSEEKAQKVLSNPAIQALSPGDRLTSVIVPDVTVDGAFDTAIQDATYVLHVGSPVPVPGFDPETQVVQPTLKGTANILAAALKTPSLKRIVITSSIVANLALTPDPSTPVTATTRLQDPGPPHPTYSPVFEAYARSKITELAETDAFIATHNPHFTVAHVAPGYVFGRNELVLDTPQFLTSNSSNTILMLSLTGVELPPLLGGYVSVDDVAAIHLKVLALEPTSNTPTGFGASTNVTWDTAFGYVEKAFPEAVKEGIFKRGALPTLPIAYDSGETERELGVEFRSYESAVVDVARQYLEKLGKA